MLCANCGTENPTGSKFCNDCGARLAAVCPACGTANLPEAHFCNECGTPLVAGPLAARVRPSPAPAPQAERRLVTILFADLVGFTPFAEERDVEEVRETLSRYFDLASEVIGRYGGTVEKFIGDAVMAVWGTPTAHEDDAERAVRAGLDLTASVSRLGPRIQARVGILTGEAAVTLGATNQGMVAGDLVNTASRLQSVAPTGAVLVGEATMRAASRAIVFEPAGEQALKGKTAPAPAWRALRVVAERGGRNRSETLEAPFVGRDDELRLLKDLFHATSREGRARLVSVVGPAGIGKSRLAWEFLKYIDGLVENVWFHHGRSPAYGEGITFWALGEMVRGRAGLLENDDEATTRSKVAAMLAQHVPASDERRWIEPALLALLGIEAGAVATEELFAAWRLFFERLSETSAVIMVFEDLQWADAGLLDFIDSLLEWSRARPIYVVTLARPELLERQSDWGAGKRNFTSLFLEPLPEAAMRDMLAGLVPGLPEPTVRAIVERADGVPLYAVETVRTLLEDGKLEARPDGTYALRGEVTRLAVPESLTALIAARLDALAAADRSLLQDAAVLGQTFTPQGLAAVAGLDVLAIEPPLRTLVRRELLSVQADPRSPERGQYTFVQALIREVAYNTLAKRERKIRHLAAARYFEALESEEIAGALAGHYLAAHANAPEGPEADALAAQARVALRAAGERAAVLGSHDQARAFFDQALSVTSDAAEEADLLERSGAAAAAVGRIEAAESALKGARGRWDALGDRSGVARTIAALGRTYLTSYRFDDALGVLEPAAADFADLAAEPAVIRLQNQLARAYFLSEQEGTGTLTDRAVVVADRVLAAAEPANLVDVVSDALITKGTALWTLGRRREGAGLLRLGHEIAVQNGLMTTAHRALNNLSSRMRWEDPRAGLQAALEGLAIQKRLGQRTFQLLTNAWDNALHTGDWDVVIAELEGRRPLEVEPLARSVVLSSLYAFRVLRGETAVDLRGESDALVAGEPEASLRRLGFEWMNLMDAFVGADADQARSSAERIALIHPTDLADPYEFSARTALWARDQPAAENAIRVMETAPDRGRRIDAARAVIRAGVAALEGRPDEALASYRDALRTWQDLGCAWDEALSAIDMATLLDPAPREVRAAAERAREILVKLRAQPMLERLEAALATPVAGRRAAPVSGRGSVGAATPDRA